MSWREVKRLENKTIKIDGGKNVPKGFGICEKCIHFQWQLKQYDRLNVFCISQWGETKVLHGNDPILDCSWFEQRGGLSLRSMYDMATMINLKPKIGFVGETEIEIVPPKEDLKDDEEEE